MNTLSGRILFAAGLITAALTSGAIGQQIINDKTVELVVANENDEHRVVNVDLDLDAINKSRPVPLNPGK